MKVKKLIIMLRTLTNQNNKTYKKGKKNPQLGRRLIIDLY